MNGITEHRLISDLSICVNKCIGDKSLVEFGGIPVRKCEGP